MDKAESKLKLIDNPFESNIEGSTVEVFKTLSELIDFDVNLPCSNCDNIQYTALKTVDRNFKCSPKCLLAAKYSSISLRYPVEAHILPLVFALNELNVFRTAWSCEGHADERGTVLKQAQVWFYAMHKALPQLLATYLTTLKGIGKLKCYWQVCISPAIEVAEGTLYEVKPVDGELIDIYLDILTISKELKDGLQGLLAEGIETANTSQKISCNSVF